MKGVSTRLTGLLLVAALGVPAVGWAEDVAQVDVKSRPVVQIAILLDNSGSMSGLINQARSELWKVVNEFVTANLDGVRPELQVAVFHYGNPPATQLVPLTDDLDRVSEALFGIPVSGGSEYCGQVISMAVQDLQWSGSNRDLKMIFIAGNEPFTQGPIDYRTACQAAIKKGITVNTIHCGPGIPDGWRDGALLADGKSMNIDHTQAVVHIEAPQDAEIAKLGVHLNTTYLAFGKKGQQGLQRQEAQDSNASTSSVASAQQRAVAKANVFYRNSAWDLCDALQEGKIDLAKVKKEDLPEIMREMTLEERRGFVKTKLDERKATQEKINKLNAERVKYVAEKRKQLVEEGGDDTFDVALINAIRELASKKRYSIGQ